MMNQPSTLLKLLAPSIKKLFDSGRCVYRVGLAFAQGASCLRQPRGDRHHARLQHPELRKVAPVQRQAEQFPRQHGLSQAGDRALDQLRISAWTLISYFSVPTAEYKLRAEYGSPVN